MLGHHVATALDFTSVLARSVSRFDGPLWPMRVLAAQAVDAANGGDISEGAGAISGVGAQTVFYAFLVVVLIVPWLLAWDAAVRARATATDGTVGADPTAFFSSARERRLWGWALVVLVAIYATLSPAQQLAAELRQRNLLTLTSGAFLLLVGLVIAVRWATTGPGRREIGAGVGVMAVYLVTLVRLPVPEARSHLFEYGLVAMLIYQALLERRGNGRRVPVPWLLAAGVVALLGWVDEGIQWFLPNRVYDLVDVGLNAAFGLMAIGASLFVGFARNLDIVKRLGRRRG